MKKTFNYKNVRFETEKIIITWKNIEYQINVTDIWTMFYAKWSLKNYFDLAYNPPLGMGYLYIATKGARTFRDVIRIRIPFKNINNIPKKIFGKIQFNEEVAFPDILRLKNFF